MIKTVIASLLCVPFLVTAEVPARRLNAAAGVMSEVMSAPDKGIPLNLLARAQCIVIVPGLKGGAFGVGAKYGKGYFSCRKGADWSAPASVRIEAGSVGFQIGLIETDLVLLVMNRKGARRLLIDKFTLGGQGEVAGGPVGRSTTAQTDISLRAEMLAWSRSRGAFAGVSLQGATLRQDVGDNEEIYGRRLNNKQIIYGDIRWPQEASELHSVLDRYATRARHRRLHRR
ncbi:MAG: lipid-binding SYLF domain-containing protein [Bryobacteraceae bacterium]